VKGESYAQDERKFGAGYPAGTKDYYQIIIANRAFNYT
jgi:hypothetical protein